jgi:GAF domain-containing protein
MASQLETVSVTEISLSPVPDRDRAALELLYAISRELNTQFDLRDLLQRVLRLTLEAVDASSGSIMVLDEKGEVIEGVVAYAGKVRLQDAQNLTDTVERGLAGWVINRRQAALIPSTRDDPRWLSRSWDESDSTSRSAISVPLVSHDRVMGVLTLVHPQPGRFTEDDLSLLTAIGAYVSFNGVRMLEASTH